MTVKELKKGDYFTLKEIPFPSDSQVWIRGEYDRGSKTYSAVNFADVNRERFFPGKKAVYVDFTF